jgi:hypothetical protein
VDRIESCLQKAGLETKQGWVVQVAGSARRSKAKAIFVGPSSSPTVTVALLTPELVDHYKTQVGQGVLELAGGEVIAGNVLIQPRQPRKNPDPKVRQGLVSFGTGDHVDEIKRCAES